MKLALIKNNLVENVIAATSESIATNYPTHTVIRVDQLSPQPGIGWSYDGEFFTAPTVPEE